MSTYRVAQVTTAGGAVELAEREVPRPGPRQVRIAVEACGICHSDALFVNAALPGVSFPVVPRARDRRTGGGTGRGRAGMGIPDRRPGGGRLVRRQLRPLHALPPR
ncbi:hypothetical protein GCM10017687_01240 [Streptomyces echinatus]